MQPSVHSTPDTFKTKPIDIDLSYVPKKKHFANKLPKMLLETVLLFELDIQDHRDLSKGNVVQTS